MAETRRRRGKILPKIIKWGAVLIAATLLFAIVFSIYIWVSTDPQALMPAIGTAHGLDGAGAATITPDVVAAGAELQNYTITYTAGQGGFEKGGSIKIVYPAEVAIYGRDYRVFVPFFATNSIEWFRKAPISVKAQGKERLSVTSPSVMRRLRLVVGFYKSLWKTGAPAYSVREIAREWGAHTITVIKGRIASSEQIVITIGGKKGFRAPRYTNWTMFVIYVDGDGDGVATPIPGSPRVITTGKKTAGFRVVATSAPKTWERVKLTIIAVDDLGQVNPRYTGHVYIDAPNIPLPPAVDFLPADVGRKVLHFRTPREGVYFIVARDQQNRKGRSNPIVVEERGLHLYWGDPHLHTIMGIGNNSPEWVLKVARDDMALDFACVTLFNHTVPFSNHLKYPGVAQPQFAWGFLQFVNGHFDSPAHFAALTGFEWGNNKLGHRNVYYSPDEADSRILSHAPGYVESVGQLLDALKGHRAIVAPHSTAWRGGPFMGDKYEWGPRDDAYQRLVEVYSSHGASEFYNNTYPINARNPVKRFTGPGDQAGKRSGAFVIDALSEGYKLGMIAGGDSRFDMDRPDSYPGGLTAVWANELTSQEVWNAFYSRHVYGTTGARIFIRWTVGGGSPGTELAVDVPVEISLYIVGTAPIAEAQVIRYEYDYKTTRVFTSPTEVLKTTWNDDNPPRQGFYYLRVVQTDGQMAWAGPIWVYRR